MVKFLAFLLLALASCLASAQQVIPEHEAQRQYISFAQAAPKIFAAAIARAQPKTTDRAASTGDSYNRALEYAKQIGTKTAADQAGNAFSFLSFLPALAGSKLYGETLSYTFSGATVTVASERDIGAFVYRLRPAYQSASSPSSFNPAVRIYDPEFAFTFKTMPRYISGTYSPQNLCASSSNACTNLQPYTAGRYKWFYRDSTAPYIVACNDVSDCVQAMLSYDFYVKTYKLRTAGFDNFGQYYGGYMVRPSGNCADASDFAYLQTLLPGLACLYSLQYNFTLSGTDQTFRVTGDFESPYVRYVSLNPVPLLCPGATKYHQLAACDPRFASDVISPNTLALLVDRMFYWGSQRFGYRGLVYTPVTVRDVLAALGNTLVKFSTLGEELPPPTVEPPNPPSVPGTGGSGAASVNLGSDPAIAQPTVEGISGASILAPVWSLFPSLAAYGPGGHTSQCPTFSPSVFGASLHIEEHCQLLETQRAALGAAALLLWVVVALRIVLRA